MSSYPTPPPTSSPKQYSPPSQIHDTHPEYHISHSTSEIPKTPAQESYFRSYSAPSSPTQFPAKHAIAPLYQQPPPQSPYPPPPSSYQTAPYAQPQPYQPEQPPPPPPQSQFEPQPQPSYPTKRRAPPLTPHSPRPYSPSRLSRPHTPTRSPRPLYASPLNPIPTPYSASRPSPRPGLIKRILNKIRSALRTFASWAQRNPVFAGALSFIPMIAITGAVKVAKSVKDLGEDLGLVGSGGKKDSQDKGVRGVGEALAAEGKKSAEGLWGWGLDNFTGFAGTQKDAGPLEGIARIVQMLMNHYCKLTPSAYPRVASILLELYFLDTRH